MTSTLKTLTKTNIITLFLIGLVVIFSVWIWDYSERKVRSKEYKTLYEKNEELKKKVELLQYKNTLYLKLLNIKEDSTD